MLRRAAVTASVVAAISTGRSAAHRLLALAACTLTLPVAEWRGMRPPLPGPEAGREVTARCVA